MARGREAPHLSDLHGCAHPDFRLIGRPSGADVDNLLLRVDFRELEQGGAQPLSWLSLPHIEASPPHF